MSTDRQTLKLALEVCIELRRCGNPRQVALAIGAETALANALRDFDRSPFAKVREASAQLGKTIAEWERKFGRPSQTYGNASPSRKTALDGKDRHCR